MNVLPDKSCRKQRRLWILAGLITAVVAVLVVGWHALSLSRPEPSIAVLSSTGKARPDREIEKSEAAKEELKKIQEVTKQQQQEKSTTVQEELKKLEEELRRQQLQSERARPSPVPPIYDDRVWVNTETKVYHMMGDRWYGKTKAGKYMSEADARKAGYHASTEMTRRVEVWRAPAAERPTTERYPTVIAPAAVAVHQAFTVKVQLTQDAFTPEVQIVDDPRAAARPTGRGSLNLPLAPTRQWPITVTITAPQFHIDGPTQDTFVLKQNDDSGFAEFHLVAEQQPAFDDAPFIGVRFFSGAQYLARVVRRISIVDGAAVEETSSANRAARGFASLTGAPSSFPVNVDIRGSNPDLLVFVDGRAGERLTIEVVPLGGKVDSGTLQASPEIHEWLRESMQSLVNAGKKLRQTRGSTDNATAIAQARDRARGFGRQLYERYCPETFKLHIESLIRERKGRPQPLGTIQIQTSDPSFPWELLVPPNGDGEFLGTMFSVARWHHRPEAVSAFSERPATEIVPRIILYISPDYGDKSLAARDIETNVLARLPGYRPVNASFADVEASLARQKEGIVHFSGHANAGRTAGGGYTYSLMLDDVALDVQTLYGIKGLNVRRTLFFVNACHSAEANQYANYVDGWAPALLDAGASGYIGGLWDVFDDAAADVAKVFYQALTSGASVSESLRRARTRFDATGDPTYLAYAYYGSVFLTPLVKRAEP